MKMRKTVTGNATKSATKRSDIGSVYVLDSSIETNPSLPAGMISVVRFQRVMELCNINYEGVSRLTLHHVENEADIMRLPRSAVNRMCEFLNVAPDYLYMKRDGVEANPYRPLFNYGESTKEGLILNTMELPPKSAEEIAVEEALKSEDTAIIQFLTEYFELTDNESDAIEIAYIMEAFDAFETSHDVEIYPATTKRNRLLKSLLVQSGLHRVEKPIGGKIIPAIGGLKIKKFVAHKNGYNMRLAQSAKKDDRPELNAIMPSRLEERANTLNLTKTSVALWGGVTTPDMYALLISNWMLPNSISTLAWFLKTTPDYLCGKTNDSDTGSEETLGYMGYGYEDRKTYAPIDGRNLVISDHELTKFGVPDYMIPWLRDGVHYIPFDIYKSIEARQKVSGGNMLLADAGDVHFPDRSLIRYTETKPIVVESVQAEQETAVPVPDIEYASASDQSAKKWLKKFVNAHLKFTKYDDDVMNGLTIHGMYVSCCVSTGYPVLNYKNFEKYLKSRGAKETAEYASLSGIAPSTNLLNGAVIISHKYEKVESLSDINKLEVVDVVTDGTVTADEVVATMSFDEMLDKTTKNAEVKSDREVETEINIKEEPNMIDMTDSLIDTTKIMAGVDKASDTDLVNLSNNIVASIEKLEKLQSYIKKLQELRAFKAELGL